MTSECRTSLKYLSTVLACQNLGTLFYFELLILDICFVEWTDLIWHGDWAFPWHQRLRLDGCYDGYIFVGLTVERHIFLSLLVMREELIFNSVDVYRLS